MSPTSWNQRSARRRRRARIYSFEQIESRTLLSATLAGYWRFDDGTGTVAADSSGQGNNGTLVAGPTWTTGIVGGAVKMDGVNDLVDVPDRPSLDFTGGITLSAWVKPTAVATQRVITKGSGTANGYELDLSNTGHAFVRFNQTTSGDTYRLDANAAYPTDGNTWVHLAATYDGSSIKIYVNGVLDRSKAAAFTIGTNNVDLGLGADVVLPNKTSGKNTLKGQMDEVRIYNGALSAQEILALANRPPVVNAGPNQTITLPSSAALNGTVSDDGQPNPPGAVTVTWTQVSGPGTVTFANAAAANTTASFPAGGTYTLRLSANDGALSSSNDTIVTVNPATPTVQLLQGVQSSANTGEKPQAKMWFYDNTWWAVFPTNNGTYVWRLDGTAWTQVLKVSNKHNTHADVRQVGNMVHMLLFAGNGTNANPHGETTPVTVEISSIQEVPGTSGSPPTYQFWSQRNVNSQGNNNASVTLPVGVETATIDVDSTGRMWLASDSQTDIGVQYSDGPYSTWSSRIVLATGVSTDDICAVTHLSNGSVGVFWSNQTTQRFGFRVHQDGSDPTVWSADEVPASGSALNIGAGESDDHMNLAVGSDGTLYVAAKTSYDTNTDVKIAFLVRRPPTAGSLTGTWDPLYTVDTDGTRPIVELNEAQGTVMVFYTKNDASDGDIAYKMSSLASINFSAPPTVLIPGRLNNVSGTHQSVSNDLVVIAADTNFVVQGAHLTWS